MCLSDAKIKVIFAHEFVHLSNTNTDIIWFIYVRNLIVSIMFLILRVILFRISFFEFYLKKIMFYIYNKLFKKINWRDFYEK